MKYSVITLSDRAFNNVYDDTSGLHIQTELNDILTLDQYCLISDDAKELEALITRLSATSDLIITTGGTGLCSRDITVGVVEKLMDYEVRGISTAIHKYSLDKSPSAMFSRALGAVYNRTLIITLPGSLKAVSELTEYFKPHLEHGLAHLLDQKVH